MTFGVIAAANGEQRRVVDTGEEHQPTNSGGGANAKCHGVC